MRFQEFPKPFGREPLEAGIVRLHAVTNLQVMHRVADEPTHFDERMPVEFVLHDARLFGRLLIECIEGKDAAGLES